MCTLFKIYLRVYLFTYFMIWYVKISEQYIFHISYVFQRLISPSPALLRPTSPITSHPTSTSVTGTASPILRGVQPELYGAVAARNTTYNEIVSYFTALESAHFGIRTSPART